MPHPTHTADALTLTRRAALASAGGLLLAPVTGLHAKPQPASPTTPAKPPAAPAVRPQALQVPGGVARLSLGPAAARPRALVRQGETVCSLLHVRTPERLQWLYFTHLYPALASRQIHVIVRQDQLHRFASTDGQPLQLAELLQRQDLSGLLPRNRSFGPRIDQLLKAAGEQGPKTLALGRSTHVLAMLKAGRMDYTLEYPGVVDEFQHSHPDGAELARLPLAEGRSTALATAACSRNPAGRQAIAAIDQVVRQLSAAQRESWLRQWRPEGLEPEDRQRLQRYLDERARGPAQIE